ncbi:MAG TPA: hypothetical protein VF432_29215 [Thermoanaerobaculia bacterium]
MGGKEIDAKVTRKALRSRSGKLLKAGPASTSSTRRCVTARPWSSTASGFSVGSTNFDDRSFRLNDEANLNIHDEEFAAVRQTAIFEADLARARRISLEGWQNRPWPRS